MKDEQTSPTRMGKQELVNLLLNLGCTKEQLLDDKGKSIKRPKLLEKLKEYQRGEQGLSLLTEAEEDEDDVGVEVGPDTEEDQDETSDTEEIDPPTPNDPEWTQFVLGKFMDDEVDGKNPRVEGLRRVAGLLVGELIEEGCDLVAVPTEDNRFRACVKAWGVFLTADGREKRFEALADAHSENCLEDYATYLVAMADTRAKGRMFRNALHLRKVVAAEEISKTFGAASDIQKGGAIHTSQISMIRLMSERHKFSIADVLDDLCIKYEMNNQTGDVNLQSLTYEDALMAAKKMREMKEEKESKS